ncbi:23S rRNA (guanosine(2251)-2'-O)-methyltransferase RlmB [Sulfurovum sp. zt1-1]|uniref:23S rRNA (Guanosine(2251)-2'-O)-methyltransferase RlmB n=1 Tax=Sulfurovum zhangzhouensis TaxID=3019067 RepID=A0ABT7QXX4_9BACT|nr:23S rRNA (guanosine(2251)-2'-O)-methyltransferase RlmB [Sulfurovum zhangzhouensis]MDM5271675.1 23S rRNA (guanosine(2251)-2'-O)-methyltransferase RlmB [Sulfurovum zhangzhouensis]
MKDSQEYLAKKAFFDKVLTIYGRNAVMEALEDDSITIHKLHLSKSNQPNEQLQRMTSLAESRCIEIRYHDKASLSRISKNAKQDQGVALDIVLEHFGDEENFLQTHQSYRVIALDGVTNPQNLGMIIRSCAAGNIDAILLPTKGAAQISPLVIKASVGTLFKMPIIKTSNLAKTLQNFQTNGAKVYTLSSYAKENYKSMQYTDRTIFVLGNESEGVSEAVENLSDESIIIPMQRGVESLNVAVTASLLAFL